MTKIILGALAGLVAGAAVTWITLKPDAADDAGARKEAKEEEPHTDSQTFVRLDSEGQQHAGLRTAPLEVATLKPEVKAYGRVLDPAPLSAQMVELANARAALDASTKEFNRLKVLHAPDQNISTRALEGAEAALIRDRIALDAAQLKLVAAWGKSIAMRPDLPAFVQSLASLDTALVRVDVPLGTALRAPPTGARIAAATAPEFPVEAQFLGPAVTADLQMQGQGFLFLLGASSLRPGAAVVAWLSMAGEEEKGVIVPRSAIVRHEGDAFVYVQSSADVFERQGVQLAHPTENGWFVDEALRAGQLAVVVGAQQLLSEELKGQGGEQE